MKYQRNVIQPQRKSSSEMSFSCCLFEALHAYFSQCSSVLVRATFACRLHAANIPRHHESFCNQPAIQDPNSVSVSMDGIDYSTFSPSRRMAQKSTLLVWVKIHLVTAALRGNQSRRYRHILNTSTGKFIDTSSRNATTTPSHRTQEL